MAKGDIISRLKLESGEFDAKIKRAGQELLAYSDHCKKVGLQMDFANRDAKEFARQLGSMGTTSNTARGKINELSEAFVNLKVMYKNMTDEEKKGEFGRILSTSLDQLKVRLNDAKKDLSDVQKELGGESSSNGLNGALSTLASKMGVSGDLMGVLTTGTMGYTAAITAGAGAVAYATREWAAFNDELAKQKQITGVTTGLTGGDADALTAAARSMSKVYGTDFREAINAANTFMAQFGKTGDEAIQLLRDGMQGMIQGDGPKLLSMIQQFAPAFRDAGISADQLVAIIHNSEGGLFSEQNMNAILMGIKNIRLMTKSTSDALAQLGIDGQEMSRKMSDGSMTVFEALHKVATAIEGCKAGSQEAGQVMQYVFGRQGAMQGMKLGRAIAELNTNLDETKTQTGEVGESLKELNLKTEEFERKLMDVFGMNGWDTMNNEIKTGLLVSLTETLGRLEDIFHMLNGISRIDLSTSGAAKFFMDLTTYAYEALNPILGLLDAVSQIYKYFNGGSTGGTDDKLYNGGTIGDVVVTANRPRKTPRGGSGGGRVGRGGSVAEQTEEQLNTKKIQEYSREFETASAERQQWILKEIEVLKKRNEEIKYYQDYAQGKIRPADADVMNGTGVGLNTVNGGIGDLLNTPLDVSAIKTPLQSLEEELKNLIELQKLAWSPDQFQAYQAMIEKVQGKIGDFKGINKDGKETAKSWQGAASAISSVGSAMSQIEDPAAKVMGTIAQAIATIALTYAKSLEGTFTPWDWIAGAAAGLAQMTAVISAIHSTTGYAQGGMIKGNSYSGDNIGGLVDGSQFVGLNAGEVVLNASQQSMLAQNLQGSGGGGVHVAGILRGEDIVLIADRWGRRTGKGELLFGKNL